MKCSEFKNVIWDYVDGKRSEEMECHYSECPECRREADHCSALLKCVGKLSENEFPQELHERIMQRIREEGAPQKIQTKKHKYMRLASGIAVALVITFVGVLAARNGLLSDNSTGGAKQPQYAVADVRATIQGSKEAAAESAGTADADGSARETDAPYSLSVAPTMGAMASGSITSNVINVQPTDRERVEAYLTTNAIPFDETDNEIFAYAYGETFDKFKAFLVNELGMDVPENTDNQYQTTIVFETVAIP